MDRHETSRPSAEKPQKVIFIGGCSRSGSTLLGRLLNQVDGFFHVGELHQIWKKCFGQNWSCECGELFRSCDLWMDIIDETFGYVHGVDAQALRTLKRQAYRHHLLPAWRKRTKGKSRAAADEYGDILARMLHAAARKTHSRVIVDSSKNAAHGLCLLHAPGLEVYVVHLVRDSRAVAHSLARVREHPGPDGKPVLQTQASPKEAVR